MDEKTERASLSMFNTGTDDLELLVCFMQMTKAKVKGEGCVYATVTNLILVYLI